MEEELGNPEKAMILYQEVLRKYPGHIPSVTVKYLVQSYNHIYSSVFKNYLFF